MLTIKEAANTIKRPKSELRFDLSDNQATEWLVAYMKWYLYVNDLETTGNN